MRDLGICLLMLLCSISVIGQKTGYAQKSKRRLPSVPIYSAGDLAAKVPPPKPDDVKSLDAIMAAAYAVISGPPGQRDWNRFRSLFIPEARLTQAGKRPDGTSLVISWSVEEYAHDAQAIFEKEGFYESPIVNRPQSYGNMAQVFSSYEFRHRPGEKPFQRGVNSFQLLNDGKRWWIVSILWDWERPDNPLPANMSKD